RVLFRSPPPGIRRPATRRRIPRHKWRLPVGLDQYPHHWPEYLVFVVVILNDSPYYSMFKGLSDCSLSLYRNFKGSRYFPLNFTEKCKCSPVTLPVAPVIPMGGPTLTVSPGETSIRERCP